MSETHQFQTRQQAGYRHQLPIHGQGDLRTRIGLK